jgi:alkylation response protein AidB-like acyl-CoA dehydrogenase
MASVQARIYSSRWTSSGRGNPAFWPLGAVHAMASAVRATDLACRIAGTTSIRRFSPLERCFRDIQTLRHHMFVSEARYGT